MAEKVTGAEGEKKIELSKESATVEQALSVATADELAEYEKRRAIIERGWAPGLCEIPEAALPITRIIVEGDGRLPVRVTDRYWGNTYEYYSETLIDPKSNRRFHFASTLFSDRLEEELPEL